LLCPFAASSAAAKTVPSVSLFEGTPGAAVNIADLCKGKKVVLLGVPGAFTPTCSATHLPGFVKNADALKKKGINEIVCISVNDPFVHSAWGKAQNADGKVRMLADTNADLTKALGLDFEAKVLGGTRCKRFSALVEDGKITKLNVEPDNVGATCSLAEPLLKELK
jgi:peroxiredoxin 5